MSTYLAARPAWLALFLGACTLHHAPASPDAWLDRAQYPFPTRSLAVDGGRMSYVDVGEGPVVVLVHGTPSWSWEWRALIADLSRDHRVIAPDHVGFGLSEKPSDWEGTPAAHSANLGRLLDHLAVTDVTLGVHDFGGPIGLGWAVDHPERVSRLVVLNTWMWAEPKARNVSRFVSGPIGRFLYLQRNFSARRLVPMTMRARPSDDVLRHYTHPFAEAGSRLGPWRLGVELAGSAAWYEERWAKIGAIAEKPALLVWGADDTTFGAAELSRWQATLKDARTVTLPGVGHFPQEEAPAAVVSAVRAFLE